MFNQFIQKITRRRIQIALGAIWLIDGFLQLQHQMFTPNFVHDVIGPAIQGQPFYITSVTHFFIRLFLLQPFVFNSLIAIIQLGIGVLLIRKSTARYGVICSIVWGLFVWYVGEGMGGLATGQTLLLMGAPGAALLYAVIAYAVIPSQASRGKALTQPAAWLVYAWMILWLGGAVLQLMHGQNTTADLASMISSMAHGAPGWLNTLDLNIARAIQHQGNWLVAVFVLIQALIGVGALLTKRLRFAAIIGGVIVSLVFWVIGQSLGSYYSGLATDPSSAPLIILLGIAVLGTPAVYLGIV